MHYAKQRASVRAIAFAAIWGAAVLLTSSPSLGHVRVDPYQTNPGQFSTFVFWLYHGCEDSPTTKLTVQIPDGLAVVTPQVKSGWEISTVSTVYATPINVYGTEVSEGNIGISWFGGAIPASYMDTFVLTAFISSEQSEDLKFLVVQECDGDVEPEEFVSEVKISRSEAESGPEKDQGAAALPGYQPPERLALFLSSLALMAGTVALILALAQRSSLPNTRVSPGTLGRTAPG